MHLTPQAGTRLPGESTCLLGQQEHKSITENTSIPYHDLVQGTSPDLTMAAAHQNTWDTLVQLASCAECTAAATGEAAAISGISITLTLYEQHEQHTPQQLAVEAVAVGGLQEQHVQALRGRELRRQRQRGHDPISSCPSIPPALLAHPITHKAPCPCETPQAPLYKGVQAGQLKEQVQLRADRYVHAEQQRARSQSGG